MRDCQVALKGKATAAVVDLGVAWVLATIAVNLEASAVTASGAVRRFVDMMRRLLMPSCWWCVFCVLCFVFCVLCFLCVCLMSFVVRRRTVLAVEAAASPPLLLRAAAAAVAAARRRRCFSLTPSHPLPHAHAQLVWDAPVGCNTPRDAMRVWLRRVLANSSAAATLMKWLEGDLTGARLAAMRGFAPALQMRRTIERACQE